LDDEECAQFQTQEDIEATCADLERCGHAGFAMFNYPTSELCERLILVQHLCPGSCDGDCCNEELDPPTCDPQAHQGPMLSDSECTDLQICDRLQWTSFSNLSLSTIRNVSDHTKYHAWIHSSDPLCNASKKAYPKCKWCLDESDLCFNQLSPPSCEVALSDTNDTYLDAQSTENLCTQLHDSFEPDADMQGTLSNSSNLLLGPNQQLG